MQAALRAGFPPERIVFAGVGKTEAELELGLREGIGDFNAESEEELVRLAASRGADGEDDAGLPAREPRHRPALPPLHLHRPPREQVRRRHRSRPRRSCGARGSCPALRVVGLQCHIGSQITDLEPLGEAAREMAEL